MQSTTPYAKLWQKIFKFPVRAAALFGSGSAGLELNDHLYYKLVKLCFFSRCLGFAFLGTVYFFLFTVPYAELQRLMQGLAKFLFSNRAAAHLVVAPATLWFFQIRRAA